MKKAILIGITIFLILMLVGCNSNTSIESSKDTKDNVDKQTENTESEMEEETVNKEVEAVDEMPKKFQELLDKHEKIKAYHYYYNEPPNNQGTNIYYVKGDKIRVDIIQSDVTLRKKYTSVFLNTKEKTAVGICKLDDLRCPDGEIRIDVDYDGYYRKTPIDWMNEAGVGEFTAGQTIDQKITKVYIFQKDGYEYKYFIDDYSGMPMRIEKNKDGSTDVWNFKELGANDFQENYVTP